MESYYFTTNAHQTDNTHFTGITRDTNKTLYILMFSDRVQS